MPVDKNRHKKEIVSQARNSNYEQIYATHPVSRFQFKTIIMGNLTVKHLLLRKKKVIVKTFLGVAFFKILSRLKYQD